MQLFWYDCRGVSAEFLKEFEPLVQSFALFLRFCLSFELGFPTVLLLSNPEPTLLFIRTGIVKCESKLMDLDKHFRWEMFDGDQVKLPENATENK